MLEKNIILSPKTFLRWPTCKWITIQNSFASSTIFALETNLLSKIRWSLDLPLYANPPPPSVGVAGFGYPQTLPARGQLQVLTGVSLIQPHKTEVIGGKSWVQVGHLSRDNYVWHQISGKTIACSSHSNKLRCKTISLLVSSQFQCFITAPGVDFFFHLFFPFITWFNNRQASPSM